LYIFLATLYAVFTPKWQTPDEPAHFNYIRAIAETGALPVLQRGDYDQAYLEQIKAARFPPTMPIDAIRYESYQPPLYYLSATPVYLVARVLSDQSKDGIDATVIALRLFSVALGVIVLLVAFRIVREIFPDDDWLALATVGLMATVPQHLAVSASISNDLAAELVLVLILWLAIRRAKNTITNRRFVILGGILYGAALLTKTTAYVPGALLLVAAEIAHFRILNHEFRITNSGKLLMLFALAALIASPMFLRGALVYGVADPLGIARHDAVVIGQPTTAEVIAQRGLARVAFDFFAVTFKSFWAQFGWMGVLVNDRIYVALALLCAVALLGFTLYASRIIRQRELLTETQRWCVGLLIVLLAVAVADYVAYNFKFLQFQGRYLFPALISIAFVLVIGLREIVAREYRRVVFALLYVALLALDLVCLFWFTVPQLRIAN
ncbi:MAG: glycosyltransferase family 39 protein, partial [Anaerolineales bacterium]|nr:glycosyltransferase family 39 protein [Anaerolineales bacterium]